MSDPETIARPLWASVDNVDYLKMHPACGAMTLRYVFGEQAASIAAWCAIYACLDGDHRRYRGWLSAFKQLQSPGATDSI